MLLLFGWVLNQDDLTVKVIMPLAFLHFTRMQTAWIPEYSKGEVNMNSSGAVKQGAQEQNGKGFFWLVYLF